jgi:hypothetical protein
MEHIELWYVNVFVSDLGRAVEQLRAESRALARLAAGWYASS